MIIENSDALKKYLMDALGRISDADPAALSRYILALLKKPRTEADLRVFFLDQLQIFLTKDTAKFVEQLFEVIKTKSYLPSEERECSPKSEKNESRGRDTDKDTQSSENHKSREKRREKNRSGAEPHNKKKRSLSSSRSRSSSPERKKIVRDREKDSVSTHFYLNEKGVTHTFNNREVVPSKKSPPDPVLLNSVTPEYIVQTRNEKMPKRCKDYDERGYCLLGDSCRYNHGLDPLIVEDVSVLNFAHVLNNSVSSSLTVCVREEKDPPPPPPPPPPTSPPPLPPPLPATGIEYIPEPYNPECPAMMGPLNTPKECDNYYGVSLPKSFQVPSLIPSQPQSLIQSRVQNSKPIRSRELIGVPTVDCKKGDKSELLSSSRKRKRDNRLYLSSHPLSKQKRLVPQSTNTLELRRVPPKLNNITALHEHFCPFGKIMNIQVCYDDDPEAALVTFESAVDAAAAYKSTEAVLNNRFIKVLLHDAEKKNEKNKDIYTEKETNDKKEENNVSHTNAYTQRNFRSRKGLFESVIYSKGNLSKTVFLAKTKTDASAGSSPSQGMSPKDEKKHAVSKMDLYKKKQEFLEAQIQHQKLIFERLQTCRNAKQRETLKKIIEDLSSKITTLQDELKSVFLKEKSNSQKSVAERKKELLDAEMDLYKTLNKSQNESDTSALLMKVHELKEKTKAFGEKTGLKIKRPPLTNKSVMNFSKLLKTDKRPKSLLVTGIEDKDFLVNFLQKFPGVEKISPVSTGCTVTLHSRKAAETMLRTLNGLTLGEENLSVSWHQDDQQSISEDAKDAKEKKDSLHFDGDEDEDEEDSEGRSWRR